MGIKGYGAQRLIQEFSDKNWKWRGIKKLSRKVHKTGLLDLLTGSGRPRTSHSCVLQRGAVADWWYSWPMASTLASLCLSQRWTFWTYVVTIKYRENKWINFTHHTMLHATGVVLRVHYKVWNVMFYFHKVVYVQYLGEVGVFHTWVKKFIPLYNSAKIIKIDREFPKLWSQMYCHLFHGSQCISVQSVLCTGAWVGKLFVT